MDYPESNWADRANSVPTGTWGRYNHLNSTLPETEKALLTEGPVHPKITISDRGRGKNWKHPHSKERENQQVVISTGIIIMFMNDINKILSSPIWNPCASLFWHCSLSNFKKTRGYKTPRNNEFNIESIPSMQSWPYETVRKILRDD